MGIFRALATAGRLEERLEAVERSLAELRDEHKRAVRLLDADMDQLWDKVKAWAGRQAKRGSSASATTGDPTLETPPAASSSTTPQAPLTPEQWQEKILAGRKRAVPNRHT